MRYDRTSKRIVTVLDLTFQRFELSSLFFFNFYFLSFFFFFWSDNDIYFVFGRYGCSSVAAADAVADVAAAAGPAFVACYHCHLPRSSYKHGASLKAPYPLRIYHSGFLIQKWRRTMFRFGFGFTSEICGGVLSGRNSLAQAVFVFSTFRTFKKKRRRKKREEKKRRSSIISRISPSREREL